MTPYLCVKGAVQAIEFYKKALSATERMRIAHPDGRVGHAEIQIGDSVIMLSDEFPEMGGRSPQSLGGSPVSIHLYVEDDNRQRENVSGPDISQTEQNSCGSIPGTRLMANRWIFVEVMELKGRLIQHHRVYWGWFGLSILKKGQHYPLRTARGSIRRA